ncbi:isoleucyl-trna synthetase [Moniliophthora roreri MCA 2997]|uniref:isoleucine--tRNA ligase n=1 Tax=Moniliophthora roreri (strain MCA 2997) TaxID=1381753 RepID=V2XG22_MONRO|nr:isoleucyl-trna synthetase [Moniliophthora roreri MCA 2997]
MKLKLPSIRPWRRYLSTSPSWYSMDNKAFSKTLLLPKTKFPLWSDPSKTEISFRPRTCEELYRWQWNNGSGPLFVFLDGPPYANGNLHMGHALNKILKDIINRFYLSQGRKVHYYPGWDCHGLPIENKALQELGKDSKSLPPSTIREAARNTATREIASQKAQFQDFGIMANWHNDSATYRTLDHRYEIRQLRIFQKMVEKGLIYRHYRPVHYSPSSRSALAEAELVYKDDHVSHSVYVSFTLDQAAAAQLNFPGIDTVELLVWTTTPWTLTANMGIAINPALSYSVLRHGSAQTALIAAKDRIPSLISDQIIDETGLEVIAEIPGSVLLGLSYKPIFTPLTQQQTPSLKIIEASHVTSDSGTGLVHCAPAHGAEDYHAFHSLGLLSDPTAMICHVDAEGAFNAEVQKIVGDKAAETLIGQPVLDSGSRTVVELLKEIKALRKIKRVKHRYPYDWKTDKPVIVTATSQWFANLDGIKEKALAALDEVLFVPPSSRNRLESFIRSRSEWCISRQRVWGVPIPALHHIPTDTALLNSDSLNHILSVLEQKGVAHWWDGPVEDFLPPSASNSNPAEWRKSTDTMDVWFDSGSSWSMLPEMGVGRNSETGREFEADVCLEGTDQHRGWFQSQLLTYVSVAPEDAPPKAPYSTLITHGMVLDESGKKMSKSLGNIVSPLSIVHGGKDKKKEPAYGADILRLWVATVEYGQDMSIGPTVLAQTAESMRKIRNSMRFMLGNIDEESRNIVVPREQMGLAERYVMHELFTLEQTALQGYKSYNFLKVMSAVINYCNITLSSLYFDITKDCLYANARDSAERRAIVAVLQKTLTTVTNIVAPVLPHLAEEVNATHYGSSTSVFANKWTPLETDWQDPEAFKDMNTLLSVRKVVLILLEKARTAK